MNKMNRMNNLLKIDLSELDGEKAFIEFNDNPIFKLIISQEDYFDQISFVYQDFILELKDNILYIKYYGDFEFLDPILINDFRKKEFKKRKFIYEDKLEIAPDISEKIKKVRELAIEKKEWYKVALRFSLELKEFFKEYIYALGFRIEHRLNTEILVKKESDAEKEKVNFYYTFNDLVEEALNPFLIKLFYKNVKKISRLKSF